MRRITSSLIVFSMAFLAVGPSQAASHKAKVKYHHADVTKAPHRICDWIGPGGRAVYRCKVIEYPQPSFVVTDNAAAHRTCGWVGPGGRASYVCR